MDAYINSISSSAPILTRHGIPSGANSLQGALQSGPELVQRASSSSTSSKSPGSSAVLGDGIQRSLSIPSLDQDMQRQLDEYNRSITVIVWYKADTEPIRLQHMNPTFPYFQLLQLSSLAVDLGLALGSYIDAWDFKTRKWEQHTMSTVRLVATQQRLLYKTRRNLLEGLGERECLGLQEELQAQTITKLEPDHHKRPSSGGAVAAGPPQKVHISNNYYMARQPLDPGTSSAAGPSQPAVLYPAPSPKPASPAPPPTPPLPPLPAHLANPGPAIPYHPHPPLKRWPNDYTVAELTAGFNAMELLVRSSSSSSAADGSGAGPAGSMTQRTAFERVFGSRYVKSTVCRHRGVWRKAAGPLREEFEAMGADERACWGEFVRRIEGRPPGKAPQNGNGFSATTGPATIPRQPGPGLGVIMYPPMAGLHVPTDSMPKRIGDDNSVADELPVMASLQNPEAIPSK